MKVVPSMRSVVLPFSPEPAFVKGKKRCCVASPSDLG